MHSLIGALDFMERELVQRARALVENLESIAVADARELEATLETSRRNAVPVAGMMMIPNSPSRGQHTTYPTVAWMPRLVADAMAWKSLRKMILGLRMPLR